MTGQELSDWMMSYRVGLADPIALAANQQAIVDMAAASNSSAKAIMYAFLDEAWGHHDWRAENVSSRIRFQVRARDLRNDPITEPWHIDVLYGAFFGSGDAAFLAPVRDLLLGKRSAAPELYAAADWSLTSIATGYPHVRAALNELGGLELPRSIYDDD